MEELSDGYRSVLSMSFELIRQLARIFKHDHIFDASDETIVAPGVVMIDEIDAHLHPNWQKKDWILPHLAFSEHSVHCYHPQSIDLPGRSEWLDLPPVSARQ